MHKRTLFSLYAVLGLTVLVLVLLSGMTYDDFQRLREQSLQVAHANEVSFKAEKVISDMKEGETNQHAFLLTRDSAFLTAYLKAASITSGSIQRLARLVTDNPWQLARTDSLRLVKEQRFSDLSRVIFFSSRSSNRDSLKLALLRGQGMMETARRLVNEIEDAEQAKLSNQASLRTLTDGSLVSLSLLVLAAVLAFGGTFWSVLHELRQRWHYQARLEASNYELQQTIAELDRFAYVASHHLQEPLRKLQTFGDRLGAKYQQDLPADAQFLVGRIRDSAAQMQRLIQDLLTFARFRDVDQQTDFQAINSKNVLDHVLREFSPEITHTSASVQLTRGMWPTVRGNEPQLHTLFAQLIGNALKFVAPGERPQITITTDTVGGQEIAGTRPEDAQRRFARVVVADRGIGFDVAGAGERLFQLFQRLHNTSEYPGTGVGLALCRRIIAQHSGYLFVESKPGQGTTFFIYLPLI